MTRPRKCVIGCGRPVAISAPYADGKVAFGHKLCIKCCASLAAWRGGSEAEGLEWAARRARRVALRQRGKGKVE